MTLSGLRTKDVINVCDGTRLGKIMDIEFDPQSGRITALVVPAGFDLLVLLRGEKKGLAIPWDQICCIGDDLVIVRFDSAQSE